MENTGPSAIGVLIAALYILVPLAAVIFGVYRGEQAHRARAEELIRARTRTAYKTFVAWGALVIALALALQLGLDEVASIVFGIPAGIVLLVALSYGLMVWRAMLVGLLLLATAAFIPAINFVGMLGDPWPMAFAITYGLLVIAASFQGLRGLRGGAAA